MRSVLSDFVLDLMLCNSLCKYLLDKFVFSKNRRICSEDDHEPFDFTSFVSQKTSISELKTLLDEERDQRREEREKAAADMKMAIQRIQAEATEELKRVSGAALRREKEREEIINKFQVNIMNLSAYVFHIQSLNVNLIFRRMRRKDVHWWKP